MQAWLAQPIDRWVIHLASQALKRSPCPVWKAQALDALPHPAIPSETLSLPELSLAADGSFTFASPVKTAAMRNNTVHGKLYRAGERWASLPTAILLHGWNAELCYRYQFPYLAFLLRRAGINTAIVELPYHMHRRPRTGPVNDFISSDLNAMFEATRQAVADVRALADWLKAEGSPAIGLWGFSLGAWLAGLTIRVETRLGCAVLTTPIARMDRAIAELPFCEPVRRSLNETAINFRELNLETGAPSIDPGNVLLVESQHDLFAPAETIEQLWAAWNHPDIWRVAHGHITVLMSVPIMRRTVRWIRDHLATRDPLKSESRERG